MEALAILALSPLLAMLAWAFWCDRPAERRSGQAASASRSAKKPG